MLRSIDLRILKSVTGVIILCYFVTNCTNNIPTRENIPSPATTFTQCCLRCNLTDEN
jgi:hypothetical protein